MSFTVVGAAGVEVEPVKADDFEAKLRKIMADIRKTVLKLRLGLDSDHLAHNASAEIRRIENRLPQLTLNLALKSSDVERIRRQLRALGDRIRDIKVGADLKLNQNSIRAVRNRIRAIRDMKVTVDAELSTASLRRLRRRLRQVRDAVVRVDADLTEASLRRLRRRLRQLRDLVVSVRVDLNEASLRRLREQLDGLEVQVHIVLAHGTFSVQLGALLRDRRVQIFPTVNRTALLAARGLLASLDQTTGLRSLRRGMSALAGAVNPVTIARIGALASSLIVLGAAGITSVGNIVTLVASLGALGGALIPIPGLMLAAGVAAKTLSWAFEDIAVQAPDLVEGWKRLKVAVSENFWKTAREPIREMSRVLLPELTKQWSGTARLLGREAGVIAGATQTAFGGDFMSKFFENLNRGVANFRPALQPLMTGLADLVSFGSAQLPRLSSWASGLVTKMGEALSSMTDDGTLQRLTDGGIAALKELGNAARGLFGAVGGIAKAANQAGGSTISALADALQMLSDTINSPGFQTGLVKMFKAARQTVGNFISEAGPGLSSLATSLMDSFSKVGPTLGKSLGTLIGSLAQALSSPDVQGGLVALFQGLATAAQMIAPVFKQLQPVVGALLGHLGKLAANVLPVLARIFGTLLTAIEPVLGALVELVIKIMPVLEEVIGKVAVALSDMLSDPEFVDKLADTLIKLADVIIALLPYLPDLVDAILQIANFLIDMIAPILPVIADNLNWLLPVVLGVIAAMKAFALVSAASAAAAALGFTISIGWIIAAIAVLVAAIVLIAMNWDTVKVKGAAVLNWMRGALTGAKDWVVGAFSSIVGAVSGFWNGLTGGIASGWNSVTGGLQELWKSITGFFSDCGTWLYDFGAKIVGGLIDGIKSMLGNLSNIGTSVINSIPGASWAMGKLGIKLDNYEPGYVPKGPNVVNNWTVNNPNIQSTAQELNRSSSRTAAQMGF